MGNIFFEPGELPRELATIAGYASGLALTPGEVVRLLTRTSPGTIFTDKQTRRLLAQSVSTVVRARFDEIEFAYLCLLRAIGCVDADSGADLEGHSLAHKHAAHGRLYQDVYQYIIENDEEGFQPAEVDERVAAHFEDKADKNNTRGKVAVQIAADIRLLEFTRSRARLIDAIQKTGPEPTVSLAKLHDTRTGPMAAKTTLDVLKTGEPFFEQVFIDFLAANHHAVDSMNWRRFEELVAHHYGSKGYNVRLSEGTDDGGVDVRFWPKGRKDIVGLVQCKRWRNEVPSVFVKALYVDMLQEGASQGVLVTTSTLEKGAAEVIKERSYNIEAPGAADVQKWIMAMRTPGTGPLVS